MEGYGGPAQPSPTIAQCLNGGLGWRSGDGQGPQRGAAEGLTYDLGSPLEISFEQCLEVTLTDPNVQCSINLPDPRLRESPFYDHLQYVVSVDCVIVPRMKKREACLSVRAKRNGGFSVQDAAHNTFK